MGCSKTRPHALQQIHPCSSQAGPAAPGCGGWVSQSCAARGARAMPWPAAAPAAPRQTCAAVERGGIVRSLLAIKLLPGSCHQLSHSSRGAWDRFLPLPSSHHNPQAMFRPAHLCCSSTTASPSRLNWVESLIRAWVPTAMSLRSRHGGAEGAWHCGVYWGLAVTGNRTSQQAERLCGVEQVPGLLMQNIISPCPSPSHISPFSSCSLICRRALPVTEPVTCGAVAGSMLGGRATMQAIPPHAATAMQCWQANCSALAPSNLACCPLLPSQ